MTNGPNHPSTAAIEQLDQSGSSTDQAQSDVATTSLGRGTANAVNRVSAVSFTRFWTTVEL